MWFESGAKLSFSETRSSLTSGVSLKRQSKSASLNGVLLYATPAKDVEDDWADGGLGECSSPTGQATARFRLADRNLKPIEHSKIGKFDTIFSEKNRLLNENFQKRSINSECHSSNILIRTRSK